MESNQNQSEEEFAYLENQVQMFLEECSNINKILEKKQ